ncbi:MAG: AAA-like domain-containing protein [Candidatus Aminicenantes bacterium]|nr:AAA-like domain-containing protein [Candidatus Aminicenantes bacterium]
MDKFFNIAGLCFPGKHYMVDPLKRLTEVEDLIKKEFYFTLHAPRQTGKTTYLYALARKLNSEEKHIALVVSFETAGYSSITVDKANETLIHCVYQAAARQLPEKYRPQNPKETQYLNLKDYLETWAKSQKKPLVLLIDEIDALFDNVLISVLRQLRDGYQGRPGHFPSSVVLVGLRDVRDYKTVIRKNSVSLGTSSPFNVKSDSLFLKNFSKDEVEELLDRHTEETGQIFTAEVKNEIFTLSGGQPWLTNALAYQMVSRILKEDYSKKITLDTVFEAKNQLVMRRDTHLDSLVDKLKEARVKRIVQAIINGVNLTFDILDDDIAYVRDLGLVKQTDPLKFANPIYAEIVPRVMASPMQVSIPEEIQTPRFVNKDGSLNMEKALKDFQEFYRRNSESWLDRYEYKESAHQLLLMAFLQRIVNSGGDITREMALGNGRIDMLVKFGKQEFALELKIKRSKHTIEDGKEQLGRYLDRLGIKEGYLVIFDPADIEWEEKLYWKKTTHNKKSIFMVGV